MTHTTANTPAQFDRQAALEQLEAAATQTLLSAGAVENIRRWLTEPRYDRYAPQVAEHLAAGRWRELDDAFWTVIPFGTGGRRGRMYPIGSNAINDRTIGESAQGLAQYVKENHQGPGPLACAIAYDTRHQSRHFAELCAEIMVATGYQVFFLEDIRSTPELSFLVRHKKCACGIMVTASHNPPSDNAVKAYWSTGGQLVPPHDQAVIQRVMNTAEIQQADFAAAVAEGKVVFCKDEVDAAYLQHVKAQSFPGPRDVNVIYSPLHGVGEVSVCGALAADGFQNVEVFAPHRQPSADFPNVPGHVSNPENPAVFETIIQRGRESASDLVLATDPDADRMGCAAPVKTDPKGPWATFTGNQIAALLCDYVLEQRKKSRTLSDQHYLVKTLVTTEMVRRIGESYGVKTFGDLLVGFKWIGQVMDQQGPDRFVLGAEESHGYLVGQYARDKDAAVACMLMAELAALLKAAGQSLHEKLDSLFWQHGYHAERLVNVKMEGSEGMGLMQRLMNRFRQAPPASLAGLAITGVRDYWNQVHTRPDGSSQPITAPQERENLLIFDLSETGNYVAVRPSGTEPKIKYYMFTFVAAEQLANLELAKQEMAARLDQFEADLATFVAH